jgi:hypothetical protein
MASPSYVCDGGRCMSTYTYLYLHHFFFFFDMSAQEGGGGFELVTSALLGVVLAN